ncbi:MAG: Na/Pi symporter, partial [Stappiaceae bacterium]
MSGSLILLHLAGAVALLIWATRMVRTGVERAHGATLRRVLQGASGHPAKAAGTGFGAAVMLQSSAAVALLVTGFAAGGKIGLPIGLAMVLGADLGSALVVRVLSFDLSWLAPICLVGGVVSFLASESRTVRQTGRILVGLGLLLLALRLIGTASVPLRESESLPLFLSFLARDPAIAFLVAALFT